MSSIQFRIFLLFVCVILSQALNARHEQHMRLKNNDLNAFRAAELAKHNQLRQLHKAPALKIDNNLNQVAQKWALYLASINKMVHSQGKYGQNLYFAWASPPRDYINGAATQAWYDEIKDYNFKNAKFDSKTGHFTQVVWKNSQRVGFGFATSKDGSDYVVANYDPPGNYVGQFAQNVLPK